MTTTVAWTPLLKPSLVPLVAIHAHSPLMIDPDIYMSNRDALGSALDGVIARLTEVRDMLNRGDADALSAWKAGPSSKVSGVLRSR